MSLTVNRIESSLLTRDPGGNCVSYEKSDDVRHWLILRALADHGAGRYAADRHELDAAFDRVVDGVGRGHISLDYKPESLVWFCLPSPDHRLYLQALVYWCAQLKCSIDIMVEAHATVGNNVPLKYLFAAVTKLKRSQAMIALWEKTVFTVTMTPSTVPMRLA